MSLESATRFPVRLVESGPAGGAIFAADIAARHQLDRVLSFDMGGTTAKICLIEDHTPRTARTFEVARSYRFVRGSGMSVSVPVIEMIEIGAGGGSIADIDMLRQIRVGPASAGSEPGPAAYGRGGTAPTVTDADVVLGRISADTFGAESISLVPEAAHRAVADEIGRVLGLDVEEAAVGIAEVVDENMANAARVHAVESGRDLAGYAMIAFGGAAPLHAGHLCDKLGIRELLVPSGAGVGSAIGFLRTPFAHEAVRSLFMPLEDFDPTVIDRLLGELRAEAEAFVRQLSPIRPTIERSAFMRYAGQGWEIPVALPDGPIDEASLPQLVLRFEKSYEEFFGRPIGGVAVEAVSWAVRASIPQEQAEPVAPVPPGTSLVSDHRRSVHDPSIGRQGDAQVFDRAGLRPGDQIRGPAAIVETQTTIILGAHNVAVVQADGCLRISTEAAHA